jgi:AcrR family transcriptional regulator
MVWICIYLRIDDEKRGFAPVMEEIEQRILDAAMNVFFEKGYDGATTRKIAEKAGVNEVTLFRRFQSKENILLAVIAERHEAVLRALDSILLIENGTRLADCLRSLGHELTQFINERVGWIVLLIREGRRWPELQEALSSIPKAIVERLVSYFEQEMQLGNMRKVDARTAALTFVSHVFYIGLAGTLFEEMSGDTEKEFDGFIDILIKGVSKP